MLTSYRYLRNVCCWDEARYSLASGPIKNISLESVLKKVLFSVFAVVLLSSLALAGTGRKVVKTAQPSYPALARQMHLSGTVKIEAKVNSAGHIVDVKVLGGHPLLSAPAADAARRFVYEPAPSETTESISFNFVPDSN